MIKNKLRQPLENPSNSEPNDSLRNRDPNKDGPSCKPLPKLSDVPESEKRALLIRKLCLCCVLLYRSPEYEKETKQLTLSELSNYMACSSWKFDEDVLPEIAKMLSVSLFSRGDNVSFSGACKYIVSPWQHLQICYASLLRTLQHPDIEMELAKSFTNHYFIVQSLHLFDSADDFVRRRLAKILHRIYNRFKVYRSFIRKVISKILSRFTLQEQEHNGIQDLLWLSACIIKGLRLPLKKEYRLFFSQVLIPLHKARSLAKYHAVLSCGITEFLKKDKELVEVIMKGLSEYWPETKGEEEDLFLQELGEVLKEIPGTEFQDFMLPILHQIARCLNSSDSQVVKTVQAILFSYLERLPIEMEMAKQNMDQAFIVKLLHLFDSGDARQRQRLTEILLRSYGRFRGHQIFIWNAIDKSLRRFASEEEGHDRVPDLLRLSVCIIEESTLPLEIFSEALILLHKPRRMAVYHRELSCCITELIKKDSKIADVIINGLLLYWPKLSDRKDVLFLKELEEILRETPHAQLQSYAVRLFREISRCLNSFNFQVIKTAIYLLKQDHVKDLMVENYKALLPIVLPPVDRNARGRWNESVRDDSRCLLEFFYHHCPELVEQCLRQFLAVEVKKSKIKLKCKGTWNPRCSSSMLAEEGVLLVDGVFADGNQIAGIGWMLLDSNAKIIHASSMPIRATSAVETEAKAILAAASAAKKSSFKHIHVFSDCSLAVDVANRVDVGPVDVFHVFVRFWCSVDNTRFFINHCSHHLTAGANWLASEARRTGASNWWEEDVPKSLLDFDYSNFFLSFC